LANVELGDHAAEMAAGFQKAQLKIDRVLFRDLTCASLPLSIMPPVAQLTNLLSSMLASTSFVAMIRWFQRRPVLSKQSCRGCDHIPYAGELNLASLTKGHYRIRVTVIDLAPKPSPVRKPRLKLSKETLTAKLPRIAPV